MSSTKYAMVEDKTFGCEWNDLGIKMKGKGIGLTLKLIKMEVGDSDGEKIIVFKFYILLMQWTTKFK